MSTRRALEGKDAVRKHLLDLDNRLPALLADDSSQILRHDFVLEIAAA